jgi:hypothetical protein
MEKLAVVCLIRDVVMDDEAAVDIDHPLEVVRRELRCAAGTHRLCLGLAEDQDLLVAPFELLVPARELVLAAAQGGNRVAESLPMRRLIVVALRNLLIDDVEAVEVVGDLGELSR